MHDILTFQRTRFNQKQSQSCACVVVRQRGLASWRQQRYARRERGPLACWRGRAVNCCRAHGRRAPVCQEAAASGGPCCGHPTRQWRQRGRRRRQRRRHPPTATRRSWPQACSPAWTNDRGATGPPSSPLQAPLWRRHWPSMRRRRVTPPRQAAANTPAATCSGCTAGACLPPPPPPPTVDRWSMAAAAPPTAFPHPGVGPPKGSLSTDSRLPHGEGGPTAGRPSGAPCGGLRRGGATDTPPPPPPPPPPQPPGGRPRPPPAAPLDGLTPSASLLVGVCGRAARARRGNQSSCHRSNTGKGVPAGGPPARVCCCGEGGVGEGWRGDGTAGKKEEK